MSLLDQILTKVGVEYDDLNSAERSTLDQMLQSVKKNEVTVTTIKQYIDDMIGITSEQLADMNMKRPSFWAFMWRFRRETQLKARLKNYIFLQRMLDTPKKAQKAIEEALAALGTTKLTVGK